MPLSFAVILGGVVTTIGTSTNLVVSGLMEADGLTHTVYGPGGYRFGDYARLGFPLTIVVFAVILASA